MRRFINENTTRAVMWVVIAACLLSGVPAGAAQFQTPNPAPGFSPMGYAGMARRGVVMAAYQKAYAMNFEIWRPAGLPVGWYATFDGFPVAQVAENRWVYGKLGMDGAMTPTDILVGSVMPAEVPGLARVAQALGRSRYFDEPEFRRILDYRCDRLGYINDPLVKTAVAWTSREPAVWFWLGNRWKRIAPNSGEYTWQAFKRYRSWLGEQLRLNNVWWLGEGEELADIARQWGMLYAGSISMKGLRGQNDSGGGGYGGSIGLPGKTTSPSNGNKNEGNWDVE